MKLRVDPNEEALDITKKLIELASYLKDPEDQNKNNQKDKNSGTGSSNNNNNDDSNDSDDNLNQKNQRSNQKQNNSDPNNSNSNNQDDKKDQNNSNQSKNSNGQNKDPQKELQDAIKELNNLLNQKNPNKNNDNNESKPSGLPIQNSGDPGNQKETSPSGETGNNRQGGGGGESKSKKLIYRGKEIEIKDYHQDIKTNKNDEDKTEKEIEGTINRILQQVEDEMQRSYSSSGSGAYLRKIYQDSIKPEPPKWVNILNPYLRPDNKIDWKWQKTHNNKITRMSGGKILFRGMERPKTQLKGLCIALDNSGSITLKDFERFYSVCFGFLKVRPHVKGTVCWWDTKVPEKEDLGWGEFKDLQSFEKIVHGPKPGGGGTDPRAALEFAKEHDCLYIIIFTDGEFGKVDKKYEKDFKKVIWCLCNEKQYDAFDEPFGTKCL